MARVMPSMPHSHEWLCYRNLPRRRTGAIYQTIEVGICRRGRLRLTRRPVRNGVELSVAQEQLLGLRAIERPRAPAPEHGQLVAAFIDGAIAVNAARDCQSRPGCPVRRDQFRS